MNSVCTETYRGYSISIYPDDWLMSPDEWGDDNLFLVADHRQFYVKRDGFMLNRMESDEIKALGNQYHIFPLAAHIHSGVVLSLSRNGYPFNDPWDSCYVGAVFASKKEWRPKKKAHNAGQGLVDTWNDYLAGNVWGYVIEDKSSAHVHSCWGFYGNYRNSKDNDMLDEARAEIDADIAEKLRKHIAGRKAQIRLRVPLINRCPCPVT